MAKILGIVCMMLALIAPQVLAAPKTKGAPTSFTVLASDSLTESITEQLRHYSTHSNNVVTAIYGAPDELVRAILAGDPADLILMENSDLMTQLKQQGLLDVSSQTALAGNRLVVAADVDHRYAKLFPNPIPLEQFMPRYDELEVVMSDPATLPSGKAAAEAFERIGQWKHMEPLLVRAGSAKDALYLIAQGKRTGVVYYSDTVHNPEVFILANIPQTLHSPITYQGAVVAGDYMVEGREFLEYLQTPEAQAIFVKHGLSLPGAQMAAQ